jgi:hypothetical protein
MLYSTVQLQPTNFEKTQKNKVTVGKMGFFDRKNRIIVELVDSNW